MEIGRVTTDTNLFFDTLTYGTASAPFLAIRYLRELAEQETELLEAAHIVKHDFYMDDLLSGAATEKEAIKLRQKVSTLLQKGQFHLRKWRANSVKILKDIPKVEESDKFLKLDQEGAMKTLGLQWNAQTDTIQYSINIKQQDIVTRRNIVSQVAQIFDPLGLLGPVLIRGKCIMQQAWQIPCGWDDPLPEETQKRWHEFHSSLQELKEFNVSRNINPGNMSQSFNLVGFGDASEKAFGACLYAVSKHMEGNQRAYLMCAKSKVAPLKTLVTSIGVKRCSYAFKIS